MNSAVYRDKIVGLKLPMTWRQKLSVVVRRPFSPRVALALEDLRRLNQDSTHLSSGTNTNILRIIRGGDKSDLMELLCNRHCRQYHEEVAKKLIRRIANTAYHLYVGDLTIAGHTSIDIYATEKRDNFLAICAVNLDKFLEIEGSSIAPNAKAILADFVTRYDECTRYSGA